MPHPIVLQFIPKGSDHLYGLFTEPFKKYWQLISTRGWHKHVFLTWLFICKFEFNVRWSLHFTKTYFTCIPFYLDWRGGMVFKTTFNNISVISWRSVLLVEFIHRMRYL